MKKENGLLRQIDFFQMLASFLHLWTLCQKIPLIYLKDGLVMNTPSKIY